VGVSVVNALSEWLRLSIRRDGKSHFIEFPARCAWPPLKVTGKTERRGTEVHFLANAETFGVVEYHFDILARRLRELSFSQTTGSRSAGRPTRWKRGELRTHRRSEGVRRIYQSQQECLAWHAFSRDCAKGRHHGRGGGCSGTTPTRKQVLCFTNNIQQRDGGTHLTGLRAAMSTQLESIHRKRTKSPRRRKSRPPGDDMREGLSVASSR